MLLAIDIGNTNIVSAVFKGDEIKGRWRISTDLGCTSDEYNILFKSLFTSDGIKFSDVGGVIISSVVPKHNFELKYFCKKYFSCEAFIVGEGRGDIGIKIEADDPSEVGADRLVNAIAAYNKYGKAAVIVDFGTATTFDVIDNKGTYLGGAIAPGINLSLNALHLAAAKLPEIEIKKPKGVIGKSTKSAMQSGVYFGYKGLIRGIIENIKKEMNIEMIVVATGGLSSLFSNVDPLIDYVEPDLTINGLNQIYKIIN